MGKEKKISREDIAKMSREERMKYEIAQELGLLDQVLEEGWKTLSAKETGRIGGIMNRRRKQKEKEGYVRLSIDEEMWKTYGRKGIDYPNEQYEKLSEIVEMALQKELLSLIQQGKHVVLDFSFWNKANRVYYKRLIEKAGGTPELVYMKASKGTLQKRLYKRNQSLNANSPFIITNEILEHHYNDFQEPCGEGEKVILQEEDCVGAAIDSPDHL